MGSLNRWVRIIVFSAVNVALIASLSGCAMSRRMSDSLPNTFLKDVNLKEKKERLPFDHSWSNPTTNWDSYTALYLKPVRADLIPAESWRSSESLVITSEQDFKVATKELADNFQEQLAVEFKKKNGARLSKLVGAPGKGIAVMEIVLTEVEFSHPLEKAGLLMSPLPGSSALGSALSDPFASFALRITDGVNGALLATAADRKFAPRRLLNLDKLSASSPLREICQLWAEVIAETAATDALTTVEETTWRWLPW